MTEFERIATLEAQVLILKRMLFGMFGLLFAGAVLGATSLETVPEVIQAKRFEVVDDTGSVFVKLSMVKDPDSPKAMSGSVRVYDASKKHSIIDMGATADGNGSLNISSPTKDFENGYRDSVTLEVDQFGYADLRFTNKNGSDAVRLNSSSLGGALLLSDPSDSTGVLLGSVQGGLGLMIAGKVNAAPLVQMGVVSDNGYILVRDASGNITGYNGPRQSGEAQEESQQTDR